MRKIEINGHKLVIYDSIDELPIKRFHKFNKYLLIDSGVGSDVNDINSKIGLISQLMDRDLTKAKIELENLRQSIYLVNQEVNVRHLSFMALVKSINGEEITDLSDENLQGIQKYFQETKLTFFNKIFQSVKKKLEEEIDLYFPKQFDDVAVLEYYDRLRQRTKLQLQTLIDSKDRYDDISRIDDFLLSMVKPKIFYGRESMEIKYDKQFEDMSLLLSHELNVDIDKLSVLQYYNSFEYLKKLKATNNVGQSNKV